MKRELVKFLKKAFEMTGGELHVLIRFEVGEQLGLSPAQTDKIVDELVTTGMINKAELNKIVLSQKALYLLHKNKI